MRQKKGRQLPTTGKERDEERAGLNALGIYDTTNTRAMQAAVYPPGWLIAQLRLPLAPNPISRAQGRALHNLIQIIGRAAYRAYKLQLSIPLDVALHRLSKQQAWLLIHHITQDLEAQNAVNS